MSVALLTIGTELTRGELLNANTTWLAAQLSDRGYEVTSMVTVDDDDARIIAAMQQLAATHDILITTGGLGPTTDDRTTACAATVLGVPLERDNATIEALKARFLAYGRVMAPSNEKQADFPRGAIILDNDRGTAPGFNVRFGDCDAYFTPGVPAEMQAMFLEQILPRLTPPTAPVLTIRMRTFGKPESEVNELLDGIEEEHQVLIGYRASNAEIEVKVLATAQSGETSEQLHERASRVADQVEARLGAIVYTREQKSLAQVVGEELLAQNATFGAAESCTGGLISQMMTSVAGASRYFWGSVTSYDNSVKENVLGVQSATLRSHGAVSEQVVREMALGAQRLLGVDYALAVSGVAGPGGGSEEKPVGLVHWAVAHPAGVAVFSRIFPGSREQVQKRAALSGLWSVREVLQSKKSAASS